jgi:hypothetical protein
MKRIAFAIAVAALALAAVPGTSQAAPIASLPACVTASHDHLTQVGYWFWGWHHRRCWWAYGRWHCRY